MKQKVVFIILTALLSLCACRNGKEKLNQRLKQVITQYMESSIEGFTVDSVQILGVDSLTDLQYAYFNKVALQNYEELLEQNRMLYLTPITEEEWDEQELVINQLQKIKNQLMQCDSILLDPRTDTVIFQYFFVATNVFGKNKNAQSETLFYGFPMDKSFKIKEMDVK